MKHIEDSRYLITGGAGFIGQAMAARLVQQGANVVILDLAAKLAELKGASRYQCIAADVSEDSTYRKLDQVAPFDAVLHLAAQTSNRVSHEEPERDVVTNALGTLRLVEWCCSAGIQRLIFSSSMAVYGNPEKLPVCEDDSTHPFSYYGITKLAAEHYIRANAYRGLNATIFRLFNVYGPGQNLKNLKQGMASIYLAYILRNEAIPVTGSLKRFRDFVYIDDVVDAWMLALHDSKTFGRTFNLGTGRSITVGDLIQLIILAAGRDPREYPIHEVETHAGDQFGMRAEVTAFADVTGWSPKVSLEEGIRRMVAWARA